MPKVSIIILNYNGKAFLRNCLNSILHNSPYDLEIIIVDNNSFDGSAKDCMRDFPSCRFILNENNVGVPEGLNIGIRNCTGDFTVLLNNDIIVTQGWLDHLFKAYDLYGQALYQPKLLEMSRPDRINSAGNMINLFGFGFSRAKGTLDTNQFSEIEEVSFASGACLFCPTFILKEVGLLDSKFFGYHEDLDLGWRARMLGYKSYYVPNSIVYHHGSAQWQWSARKFYLLERNRWIVLMTNYSSKTFFKLIPFLLFIEILMWIFFAKKGMLGAKIRSYIELIRLAGYIRSRKKMISRIKKVPDDEIMNSFCYNIQLPDDVSDNKTVEQVNKLLQVLCKLSGFYGQVKFVK